MTGCFVDWKLLLEYFKVVWSWPTLVLVLAWVLTNRFRGEVAGFINRIREIKYPGGAVDSSAAVAKQADAQPTSTAFDALAAPEPHAPAVNTQIAPDVADGDLVKQQAVLEHVQQNPGPTVTEFWRISRAYQYERVYNLIFGTQLGFLDFLATNPAQPRPLTDANPFYEVHSQKVPSPNFAGWLQYLVTSSLIETVPDGTYRITATGLAFLKYIKENYPTGWQHKLF